MSMYEAFLADILEHPDDDTPRLVLADWLEEVGTDPHPRNRASEVARAEFIRAQIEYSRLDTTDVFRWAVDERVRHQREITRSLDRQRALIREWEGQWRAESGLAGTLQEERGNFITSRQATRHVFGISWARGFVDHVTCARVEDWYRGGRDAVLALGPCIVKHHPVEAVSVYGRHPWEEDAFAYWYRDDGRMVDQEYAPARLPPEIFDLLAGEHYARGPWKSYQVEDHANSALSRALLLWARGAAKARGIWPLG